MKNQYYTIAVFILVGMLTSLFQHEAYGNVSGLTPDAHLTISASEVYAEDEAADSDEWYEDEYESDEDEEDAEDYPDDETPDDDGSSEEDI